MLVETLSKASGGEARITIRSRIISALTPNFISRAIQRLKAGKGKPNDKTELVSSTESEVKNRPKFAWVFDLDGTILEKTGRIDPEILTFAVERARLGEPTCFLSARDFDGAAEKTLDPLETALKNLGEDVEPSVLKNFFFISESGGDGYVYKEDGTKDWKFDYHDSQGHSSMEFGNSRQIRELQDLAEQLANGFLWEEEGVTFPPDVVHLNSKKLFSVTLEKNPDAAISDEDWKVLQSQYMRYFKTQLANWPESLSKTHINQPDELEVQERMIVEQTGITTTLRPEWLTKAMGGQMFVEWLAERNIDPQMYNLFGDSATDLEAQDGIKQQGKPTHFYFVGNEQMMEREDLTVRPGNTSSTKKLLNEIAA